MESQKDGDKCGDEKDKRKSDRERNKGDKTRHDSEEEKIEKKKRRNPEAADPGILPMNAPVLLQTCTKQPLVITLIDKDSRLIE